MQPVKRFLLRTIDRTLDLFMRTPGPSYGPPWMITPQGVMPAPETFVKASTTDTDKRYINPNDKDSWSRRQDPLWLLNARNKERKMAKDQFLKHLPYSEKHWPYVDLPEGRVHIARYFP